MTAEKLQKLREEIAKQETRIRESQQRLEQKKAMLADAEMLFIKEQLDALDMPFDELYARLKEFAKKGDEPNEQELGQDRGAPAADRDRDEGGFSE